MFTADVRVQVPPRPPYEKAHFGVLFFVYLNKGGDEMTDWKAAPKIAHYIPPIPSDVIAANQWDEGGFIGFGRIEEHLALMGRY